MSNLLIYQSSAGSGKTYNLAREYLQIVLKNPHSYKNILAVTFTNKATAEMKERILKFLSGLSAEKMPDLCTEIASNTGIPESEISLRAKRVLSNILHDYSRFSVTTIDSFFQKVLKSFAAELDLHLKYDIELDIDHIAEWMVDNLLLLTEEDAKLQGWLKKFVFEQVEDGKSVKDIKRLLKDLARELFTEKYSSIANDASSLDPKEKLENFQCSTENLFRIKNSFRDKMGAMGKQATVICTENAISANDLFQGARGVWKYFLNIQDKNSDFKPNSYVLQCSEEAEKWVKKNHSQRERVMQVVNSSLFPLLQDILDLYNNEISRYNTVLEILRNIYSFGVLNYLEEMKSAYIREFNLIPISETQKYLQHIIQEAEDAPFVYEKTGTFLRHLLIDETQDTSLLQWKNIKPLIHHALSSGGRIVVVGDVKQSIYRWRGGDLNLLLHQIEHDLSIFPQKKENLNNNWRSKGNVVKFNNLLYSGITSLFDASPWTNLHSVYSGHSQNLKAEVEGMGYVEISFKEESEGLSYNEQAIQSSMDIIDDVVGRGFQYKDICFLIRNNSEGQILAMALKEKAIPFVSSESLFVQNSPVIKFLVSALKLIVNKSDKLSEAYFIQYFIRNILESSDSDVDNGFRGMAASEWYLKTYQEIAILRGSSVFDATEQLIDIFKLQEKEPVFLQRFQDLSLEYSNKYNSDINSFVNWWDEEIEGGKVSVIIPEGEDAVQIMTVHKSKGLEFPVVVIPFANWEAKPKQGSLLWFSVEDRERYNFSYVPLKAGKGLLDSEFHPQYMQEWESCLIDEVNSLYVATTRAEAELYIMAELPPAGKTKNLRDTLPAYLEYEFVNYLIYHVCKGMEFFRENQFSYGHKLFLEKKVDKENSGGVFDTYPVMRKISDKINLKVKRKTDDLEQIRRGKQLHKLLENIKVVEDMEDVIYSAIMEGDISETEVSYFRSTLQFLFQDNQIRSWFSPGLKIFAEQDILDVEQGKLYRPDRIIFTNDKAIVVDFKVSELLDEYLEEVGQEPGALLKRYKNQVRRYVDLLKKTGQKKVEGFILFTENARVIEVEM